MIKGIAAFFAVLAVAIPATSFAAEKSEGNNFPSKPIRLITPFEAGATTDILSRIIAEHMSAEWKESVVVDNKPGATGMIGAGMVARAEPDGYTIGNVTSSLVVMKNLVKEVPYDYQKSFSPVILLARTPLVLVVNPSVPARTLPEFMKWVSSQPGGVPYGSSGIGNSVHLTTELFKQVSGVNLIHVPYKGGAPAYQDLLGGHIKVVMSGLYTVQAAIKAGTVVPIAIASAKRDPAFPNIPTFSELGYPQVVSDEWWAIIAPARTPKSVVGKLNTEITGIFTLPEVQKKIADLNISFMGSTPEQAAKFMVEQSTRWDQVLAKAGVKPQ